MHDREVLLLRIGLLDDLDRELTPNALGDQLVGIGPIHIVVAPPPGRDVGALLPKLEEARTKLLLKQAQEAM